MRPLSGRRRRVALSPGEMEGAALLRIGAPLTLAALCNMSIAITDVVMMGWIGPMALGAGAAVSDWYSIVFYLTAGVASAGAAIFSGLIGGARLGRVRGAFVEVLLATIVLGALLAPLVFSSSRLLGWLGIESSVIPDARSYAAWMTATLFPMLAFRVCQSYLSSVERSRIVFYATLAAIPLNIVGNGIFMFGWLGFEAMGMPGAGLSSFIVAVFLACYTGIAVVRDSNFRQGGSLRPTMRGIAESFSTGIPIGVAALGEMGVYLLSTLLMVKFGAVAVAAHAVALRLSGVLFALSLGLSQAVTVRVAHFSGAGAAEAVQRVVSVGLVFAVGVAAFDVAVIFGFAGPIVDLFMDPERATAAATALATTLVWIVAPTEALAALLAMTAGALRGVKDTRVPMIYSVLCHWGIGFPAALCLGFLLQGGAVGYWLGLLAGLLTATALTAGRCRRQFRRIYTVRTGLPPAGLAWTFRQ